MLQILNSQKHVNKTAGSGKRRVVWKLQNGCSYPRDGLHAYEAAHQNGEKFTFTTIQEQYLAEISILK